MRISPLTRQGESSCNFIRAFIHLPAIHSLVDNLARGGKLSNKQTFGTLFNFQGCSSLDNFHFNFVCIVGDGSRTTTLVQSVGGISHCEGEQRFLLLIQELYLDSMGRCGELVWFQLEGSVVDN